VGEGSAGGVPSVGSFQVGEGSRMRVFEGKKLGTVVLPVEGKRDGMGKKT